MPSFLRSSRSYSFPPCIDNVDPSRTMEQELEDIDENPFAHFLTPVSEEDDPYDGMSMSAGIILPEGVRSSKTSKFKSTVADKWARYVRHNHAQLHNHYHEESPDEDEESFMQLDDNRLNDTPHVINHLTGPPSPRIIITEPTRGRAQELVAQKTHTHRRNSRTLSGHRHSWREPSPDLFTVEESEESEEDEGPILMRRTKTKTKDGVERRRSKVEVVEKARL